MHTTTQTIKFLLLIASCCLACNPDRVDTRAVKKELDKLKIKKIPEGQILSKADSLGSLVSANLQGLISKKLDSSFLKGGIKAAIPFCNLATYEEVRNAEQEFHAQIRRTSFPDKLANIKHTPDEDGKEILDAYAYSIEQKLPLYKGVQVKDTEILFHSPILLAENQCLRCHGTPGVDLSEEDFQTLKSLYPQYRSTNRKMNEFLGMWMIKFDKKELIRRIE